MTKELLVSRRVLRDVRLVDAPPQRAGQGQALLRIDRFALTANNVTYAVLGDALRYWEFFPADDGWGKVPVWGYADVVESGHDGIPVGQRLYGLFPPSPHLVVQPVRNREGGFVDGHPGRLELPAAYNWYEIVPAGEAADTDAENRRALLQPLFVLSFLLAEQLQQDEYTDARTVVVSSGSSKAAIGTMTCLRAAGAPPVAALTSRANRRFVEDLGLYDHVVEYGDEGRLPPGPAVYADFSGDRQTAEAVRRRYGDHLIAEIGVGGTRQHQPWAGHAVGRRRVFSAADALSTQVRALGKNAFGDSFGAAWQPFSAGSYAWLSVDERPGGQSAVEAWRSLVDGTADPAVGFIRSLSG